MKKNKEKITELILFISFVILFVIYQIFLYKFLGLNNKLIAFIIIINLLILIAFKD